MRVHGRKFSASVLLRGTNADSLRGDGCWKPLLRSVERPQPARRAELSCENVQIVCENISSC